MSTTGELLKRARENAELTQTELAKRAGTRQSAISAYESGKRDPTVGTLERLLNATGHRMSLNLEPLPLGQRRLPDSVMGRRLAAHRDEIRAIVASHGGRNVRVFGSVARGEDDEGSDLDLLVELPSRTGILTLGVIARDVEQLIGAPVDVVPEAAIKPQYRESILAEALDL